MISEFKYSKKKDGMLKFVFDIGLSMRKKIIFFVIWLIVINIIVLYTLKNKPQIVNIGDLNDYTPIAIIDNKLVYSYIQEDDSLAIGYYDIETNTEADLVNIENFYISSGIPTVIEESVYFPVTLKTNEHRILKIDLNDNSVEVLISEYNSNLYDSISSMNKKIYILSSNMEDNNSQINFIKSYDTITEEIKVLIQKESNQGKYINLFSCNNENLYFMYSNDKNVVIDAYNSNGKKVKTLHFDDEIREKILTDSIAQFYYFNDFIYLRTYSDYGIIGKVENDFVKKLMILPKLRIAYNCSNINGLYYVFFIRESNELFILNLQSGKFNIKNLALSSNESIRNIVSDGSNLCISVLDENINEYYKTKKNLIVNIEDI